MAGSKTRELCDGWIQDNCLVILSKHRCLAWHFMKAYNAWMSDDTPPSLIATPERDDEIAVFKHLYLDLLRQRPRYRNFRTAGHKTSNMSVRRFAAGHLVALYADSNQRHKAEFNYGPEAC